MNSPRLFVDPFGYTQYFTENDALTRNLYDAERPSYLGIQCFLNRLEDVYALPGSIILELLSNDFSTDAPLIFRAFKDVNCFQESLIYFSEAMNTIIKSKKYTGLTITLVINDIDLLPQLVSVIKAIRSSSPESQNIDLLLRIDKTISATSNAAQTREKLSSLRVIGDLFKIELLTDKKEAFLNGVTTKIENEGLLKSIHTHNIEALSDLPSHYSYQYISYANSYVIPRITEGKMETRELARELTDSLLRCLRVESTSTHSNSESELQTDFRIDKSRHREISNNALSEMLVSIACHQNPADHIKYTHYQKVVSALTTLLANSMDEKPSELFRCFGNDLPAELVVQLHRFNEGNDFEIRNSSQASDIQQLLKGLPSFSVISNLRSDYEEEFVFQLNQCVASIIDSLELRTLTNDMTEKWIEFEKSRRGIWHITSSVKDKVNRALNSEFQTLCRSTYETFSLDNHKNQDIYSLTDSLLTTIQAFTNNTKTYDSEVESSIEELIFGWCKDNEDWQSLGDYAIGEILCTENNGSTSELRKTGESAINQIRNDTELKFERLPLTDEFKNLKRCSQELLSEMREGKLNYLINLSNEILQENSRFLFRSNTVSFDALKKNNDGFFSIKQKAVKIKSSYLERWCTAVLNSLQITNLLMMTENYWSVRASKTDQRSHNWVENMIAGTETLDSNRITQSVKASECYKLHVGNDKEFRTKEFKNAWNTYIDLLLIRFVYLSNKHYTTNNIKHSRINSVLDLYDGIREAELNAPLVESTAMADNHVCRTFVSYAHGFSDNDVQALDKGIRYFNVESHGKSLPIRIITDRLLKNEETFVVSIYGMMLLSDKIIFLIDDDGFLECVYRPTFVRNFEAAFACDRLRHNSLEEKDVFIVSNERSAIPPSPLIEHVFGKEISASVMAADKHILNLGDENFILRFTEALQR